LSPVREQRTIFGEVAELYDKARAAYPEALFDDVLDYARCTAASSMRALEIGAGTGKATVALAARGVDVVALEPDAAMAAVLRRSCENFPHVRIEVTTFEDWTTSWKGFDLLYAAQAWHWVAREVRARRAAELLRADGTIALFWHRTDWSGEPVRGVRSAVEIDDGPRFLRQAVRTEKQITRVRPSIPIKLIQGDIVGLFHSDSDQVLRGL
jgi:SAM-dependent methyltransferase